MGTDHRMGRVAAVLSSPVLHKDSDMQADFGTGGSGEGPVHIGSEQVVHTGSAIVGSGRIGVVGVWQASGPPPGISLGPIYRFGPSRSASSCHSWDRTRGSL